MKYMDVPLLSDPEIERVRDLSFKEFVERSSDIFNENDGKFCTAFGWCIFVMGMIATLCVPLPLIYMDYRDRISTFKASREQKERTLIYTLKKNGFTAEFVNHKLRIS